ncbi:MAG TPA: sulfatase-like hydrolase/transferase [Sandaracinaceae bacterium]
MLRWLSRGALIGAAGALIVAVGDFGASWLWLAEPRDRVELLARLLGLEVPVGALAGAMLGAFAHLSAGPTARLARRLGGDDRAERLSALWWPLPFVLFASPALAWIAWLSFTGGSASQLPLRPLLVVLAALVLIAATWVALRVGRAIVLRAPVMSRAGAVGTVLGLGALYVAIAKIDQTLFPGLYGHLHALLAVAAWLVASLAVAVLALRVRRLAALDRNTVLGPAVLAALTGVFVVCVATLGTNQTVRVALLSPRASGARSLMLALGPAIALVESRASASPAASARPRPLRRTQGGPVLEGAHVLLVTIDALRADHLGLYGYRTRPTSPALDRFARESIVFETAYAQAPHSSYSLSTLMTSEYLYQRSGLGMPLPNETLATALVRAGYHAAAFYIEGIFHTDGEQLAQYRDSGFGFPRRGHRNLNAEARTDEVLGELDAIVQAGEPPSFLWVHYFDVHEPYEDRSFGTTDVERYDGEIRVVDRALERLVREARARVTRPLVIVVTADHGEEFRDHGGVYHGSSVYQEQVRVPLLVHVPDLEPRRVRTPVEIVDLAPTLLELLGVPPPPSMRGDDLRPLLSGADAGFGPVFASAGTKHMIVSWPHKLIADVRFGTFELFDLERDPRERDNVADEHPALVQGLEGELRAWLASLAEAEDDPYASALYRGRLADMSAAPELRAILTEGSAPALVRAEAAKLLAKLPGRETVAALVRGLSDPDEGVRAESAIALTWLERREGRAVARTLLAGEDRDRKVRAAIGIARLRDRAAVPVLVEAIGDPTVPEPHRFEAIRLLGALGDRRAVEPLLDLLDDVRMRRRAVLALGHIGDLRAFDAIVEQLLGAQHITVRESSARALALLGDPRAIEPLITVAIRDEVPSAAESLVRLGALDGHIGGLDLAPGVAGAGECRSLPRSDDDAGYLNRTYCEAGARAELTLRLPEVVRRAPSATILVRMRRADAGAVVHVRARIGEHTLETVRVDGEWAEYRFRVPAEQLDPLFVLQAEQPGARLAIDHVLVLPMTSP